VRRKRGGWKLCELTRLRMSLAKYPAALDRRFIHPRPEQKEE
jgi:hypothetical protein